MDKTRQPINPHPELITPPQWDILFAAEDLLKFSTETDTMKMGEDEEEEEGEEAPASDFHGFSFADPFGGLLEHIKSTFLTGDEAVDSEWSKWMKSPNILMAPLPGK